MDIYESTAELAEVGAGIGFWPRMWEMLTYLGLEDDLVRIAGSRDGGGEHEKRFFRLRNLRLTMSSTSGAPSEGRRAPIRRVL